VAERKPEPIGVGVGIGVELLKTDPDSDTDPDTDTNPDDSQKVTDYSIGVAGGDARIAYACISPPASCMLLPVSIHHRVSS
jgi:hypothetical protein